MNIPNLKQKETKAKGTGNIPAPISALLNSFRLGSVLQKSLRIFQKGKGKSKHTLITSLNYRYNLAQQSYAPVGDRLQDLTDKIVEEDVHNLFHNIHCFLGGQLYQASEVNTERKASHVKLYCCILLAIIASLMMLKGSGFLILGLVMFAFAAMFSASLLFFPSWEVENYRALAEELNGRIDMILSDENRKLKSLGLAWSRGANWDGIYLNKLGNHDDELRIEFSDII